MRDSNYKSISNNRAAVTISTTVYDRRALDVTSDRPLVNSLNHLTYLVSSLAKVRDTLSTDGGIERLVEILHECHNCNFNSNDNIFNSEKKILTAWKWTLAFQCLVLIGTRGTEAIRQRVVRAGMLPIIATILDNYITLHDRAFSQANRSFAGSNNNVFNGAPPQTSAGDSMTPVPNPENIDLPNHPIQRAPEPQTQNMTNENNENVNATNNATFMNQFETFQNNFNLDSSASSAAAALAVTSTMKNIPFFNGDHPNSLTNEDYENLSIDQLFKLIKTGDTCDLYDSTGSNKNIRRRYLILIMLKKLREEKEGELLDTRFLNDADYDMDNSLQFLSNMYLQHDKASTFSNLAASKASPRSFTETGVVIPRDDDIVWSLQLLAYISKYPYLKEILQNTHLVIDMSVRDKQLKLFIEKQLKNKLKKDLAIKQRPTIKPKSRKSKLLNLRLDLKEEGEHESSDPRLNFSASASSSPQIINSLSSIHEDNFMLEQDKIDLCEEDPNVENGLRVHDANVEDVSIEAGESDPEMGSVSDSGSDTDNFGNLFPTLNQNKLSELYDNIVDCESIVDRIDRELATHDLHEKINKCVDKDSQILSHLITRKRLEQKAYLKEKWDYDSYENFNIDDQVALSDTPTDPDYDDSLFEYKKVNLFPMVEKFTFLSGTDMYYWSGVIMRNSCRRNEIRGGVRQCGNLDCGKWETYPREFLKCRRCKRTKYCSRDCQTKAWHCHRNWCIPSSSSSSSGNGNTSGVENDEDNETRSAVHATTVPADIVEDDTGGLPEGGVNTTTFERNNNNDIDDIN